MQERIVYEQGGRVVLVIPCDCGLSVEEIAQKDVPAGVPYWIVNESAIPAQHLDALELDPATVGPPHGVGIGPAAWFAQREA